MSLTNTDPFPCPGTKGALGLTPLQKKTWLFALSCDLSHQPPVAQLLVGASFDNQGSIRWTRLALPDLVPNQHIVGAANFESFIVEAVCRDLRAQGVDECVIRPLISPEPNLFGPFGWLNGCRALNEESWELESDPLENSDEYFAIPLFAKVDPFVETGKSAPSIFEASVMPGPATPIQLDSGQIQPAMFFYAIEGHNLYHIATEHGFECQFGDFFDQTLTDEECDAAWAEYERHPDAVLLAWEPKVPKGWQFGGKWHGEDGPVSCFLRKREVAQ